MVANIIQYVRSQITKKKISKNTFVNLLQSNALIIFSLHKSMQNFIAEIRLPSQTPEMPPEQVKYNIIGMIGPDISIIPNNQRHNIETII